MKLTISVDSSGELVNVDVPGSLSLDDFKAYLQAETDIEPNNQVLKHNSKTFDDSSKTLEDSDVKDGDLIVLSKIRGGSGSNPNPSTAGQINSQIEFMRQQFLNDPQAGEQLRRSNPQMHSILNDPQSFQNAMQNQLEQFQSGLSPHVMSQNQRDELTRLQANPDDPESQARILEIIRQEQIDDNMKLAYELTPETFASVSMLYVNININGEKVQAFVDSGAQATIISPRLAERVGISRLIDRRFQGEARGVGSQTIEGKIHSVPISIGNSDIHIPCSFMVIDTQVDLLFGLDMLRRHRCVIDLVRDVLIVGGNIEAKFLKESEIESNAFGAGLGGTRKAGASHFGGNIFSDIPSANTRSSPSITASSAAGEAAKKRHNSGENNKKFKEEDVKSLIDLGFTKEEALFALEQTKGNVEQAAALLFQ